MEEQAKLLERVRALMAKASSTPYPEEADAFRRKADVLMTRYSIESWQVDQAQAAVGARPVPEIRWFDFNWWRDNAFKDQLWWMFAEVGRHCRCKVVTAKQTFSYGDQPGDYRMPVIGLSSDLDWFDLLFTNLMIAMIQKVDPSPRSDLVMEENMAVMREAGLPWADALNRLALAGIVPSIAAEEAQKLADETGEEVEFDNKDKSRWDGKGSKRLYFSKKVYEATIRSYRSWCAKTGHPQSYVSQSTFRRNFANGFAAEISDRLYRMSRESREAYDQDHEAGSMALAVRDIQQVIIDMMYEEWPELKPHPTNCQCAACVRHREQMKKPVRYRGSTKQEKVDYAAKEAGRAAARQVSLSNDSNKRVGGSTPGLPSGE